MGRAAPVAPSAFAFVPFLRRALLFVVPVFALWWLVTPLYNRALISTTEVVVRLLEAPSPVTRLVPRRPHDMHLQRRDLRRPGAAPLYSVRVTDVHFPVILTAALFLAVPASALAQPGRRSRGATKQRLVDLGRALLVSLVVHLVSLVFWVQFVYATQLGEWSMQHYGAFARNFWGLGKHLLDLPFKLALPLILWCGFYFHLLAPGSAGAES